MSLWSAVIRVCYAVWLVHEQVAMAALDCGALAFAVDLIKAVRKKFPDSVRAKRLQVHL